MQLIFLKLYSYRPCGRTGTTAMMTFFKRGHQFKRRRVVLCYQFMLSGTRVADVIFSKFTTVYRNRLVLAPENSTCRNQRTAACHIYIYMYIYMCVCVFSYLFSVSYVVRFGRARSWWQHYIHAVISFLLRFYACVTTLICTMVCINRCLPFENRL